MRKGAKAAFETKILDVGRDLARSLSGVLTAIPGGPHRPQALARAMGLNVVLTSRLLKAAQQDDPMAVAHMIPGPEPLRRLLRAAERKKVDPALIREARAAVDRFQQLIDVEAGDRSALDAIISGWLPDARERVELIAKQSVYRGVSQLLGTACDIQYCTMLLHPSAVSDDRADQLVVVMVRGLRRTRPGPIVNYDSVHTSGPVLTLTGQPVEELHGLLLEDFCSEPLPQLQVSHFGDRALYTLTGDSVGAQSAVNLAHATLLPARKERFRAVDQPPRSVTMAVGVSLPCKTLIFDVLVHEDIYPGQTPTLHLYRGTVGDGTADPDDAAHDINRIDVIESLEPLGRGISRLRTAENSAYTDLIQHACTAREWDGERLRGFRCRIEFPMYSSQVLMAFDLPPRRA